MIICSKVRALILSAVMLTVASVSGYAQIDTLKVKQVDTTICAGLPKAPCDTVVVKQTDTTASVRTPQAPSDSVVVKQVVKQVVDTTVRVRTPKAPGDTVKVRQADTTKFISAAEAPCDTVVVKQVDTLCARSPEEIRDSLRVISSAISTNLVWAGIATPNISFEMPLSQHFSIGVSGAFKPGVNPKTHAILWPRWSPFDHDMYNETKWPHLAVLPYLRWWPKETFRGFFLEGDLLYSHYNIGGVHLPFGLYPDLAKYRLEGDFYGAGLSLGGAIWITRHINLVLSAGLIAGYKNATRYECPWCGAEVGTTAGPELVPKLDVSIAYHIFDLKREEKREEKKQNKR